MQLSCSSYVCRHRLVDVWAEQWRTYKLNWYFILYGCIAVCCQFLILVFPFVILFVFVHRCFPDLVESQQGSEPFFFRVLAIQLDCHFLLVGGCTCVLFLTLLYWWHLQRTSQKVNLARLLAWFYSIYITFLEDKCTMILTNLTNMNAIAI